MQSIDDIPLFDGLQEPMRNEIDKSLRWKAFSNTEQIIDRKSDSADIIFVTKGRVRVVVYSLSGREVALDDVCAGGFFGELSAIDSGPRSASVMALEESVLAFLPPEQFARLLRQETSVGIKIMRRLSKIIRQATSRIVDLSTLGANNRVHAELLRLAKESGVTDNMSKLKPIPVHSDIASRVSTTRETVARVLNDLARKSVVERGADSLDILDIEQLQTLVDEVRGD